METKPTCSACGDGPTETKRRHLELLGPEALERLSLPLNSSYQLCIKCLSDTVVGRNDVPVKMWVKSLGGKIINDVFYSSRVKKDVSKPQHKHKLTTRQRSILQLLAQTGPMSLDAIQSIEDLPYGTTHYNLTVLARVGYIKRTKDSTGPYEYGINRGERES